MTVEPPINAEELPEDALRRCITELLQTQAEREELRTSLSAARSDTASKDRELKGIAKLYRGLEYERHRVRQLLISTNAAPGMPNPDDSIVAAVSWLVDDWRIERGANDLDGAERAADPLDDAPLDTWAIVELMGHRRVAGRVREAQVAGAGFLRLDVPAAGDSPARSQYVSPTSVYALHPVDETTARRVAQAWRSEPVTAWEMRDMPALTAPTDHVAGLDAWATQS